MMNPKAIITKRKKKLRTAQAVFNKKTGQTEFQIKESGRIIHRENVEDMQARHQQENPEYRAEESRQKAQESIERMQARANQDNEDPQ